MWHSYMTWYMSFPYIINLPQTVWKLWPTQDFCFRGDIYITKRERVLFHATHLLVLPTEYYQIISNSMGVMACTRSWLKGRWLHNEESESCLFCTRHAYWFSSLFLPNIIKKCLRVSKFWRTQGCISDIYFREDNYMTKKARVVSLVRNTTTGPPLYPYQI